MKKHNFCNQTNKAQLIDCHRSAEHCCATLMEGIMYLLLGDPSIFSNYSTVSRPQNWSFILCCCSRCTLQRMRLLKESHCHVKDARAMGKQHDCVLYLEQELHCQGFHSEAGISRQENESPIRSKFIPRSRKCSGLPWWSLLLPSLLKEMNWYD